MEEGAIDITTYVTDNWNDPGEKKDSGEWTSTNRDAKMDDFKVYRRN
jgi:hypothetical protein